MWSTSIIKYQIRAFKVSIPTLLITISTCHHSKETRTTLYHLVVALSSLSPLVSLSLINIAKTMVLTFNYFLQNVGYYQKESEVKIIEPISRIISCLVRIIVKRASRLINYLIYIPFLSIISKAFHIRIKMQNLHFNICQLFIFDYHSSTYVNTKASLSETQQKIT